MQYGQTLWSIAITYGTTIKEIQRLNWNTEDVYVGQQLLVMKGATPHHRWRLFQSLSAFPTRQPTATATLVATSSATRT
ncbi:MAG: LysM domain-containing protein [Anaerolineales bacterium]